MNAPAAAVWFDGLREHARRCPDEAAVTTAHTQGSGGPLRYAGVSFDAMDSWSDALVERFAADGIGPGTRTIVLVEPGPELYAVLFALFRAGAIPVVIDPGMGVRPMLRCLSAVEAQAFVGIPKAHVLRVLFRRAFRDVDVRVTVGRRWFWGGRTLDRLGRTPVGPVPTRVPAPDDVAMIAFTTGSTGPAKAVELTHANLAAMLERTAALTGVTAGERALVTLPVFGVLYLLLGVGIVLPPLVPSRVGATDPEHVVDAVTRFGIDTLFASPAVLAPLLAHGSDRGISLPSVRAVFSGGAPVPAAVVEGLRALLPEDAQVYAGYGATEAIPMSAIESRELADGLAERAREGDGICIGRPDAALAMRIIEITDEPIAQWHSAVPLRSGVGEMVVSGAVVSRHYRWPQDADTLGKIVDGPRVWHRTGDLGRIDELGRIWFCGRKSQRVVTDGVALHTVQVEQVFNAVAGVARTALVGVGERPHQRPVLCVELVPGADAPTVTAALREHGKARPLTAPVHDFLIHPGFPVDIRHNAKIGREALGVWAAKQLRKDGAR